MKRNIEKSKNRRAVKKKLPETKLLTNKKIDPPPTTLFDGFTHTNTKNRRERRRTSRSRRRLEWERYSQLTLRGREYSRTPYGSYWTVIGSPKILHPRVSTWRTEIRSIVSWSRSAAAGGGVYRRSRRGGDRSVASSGIRGESESGVNELNRTIRGDKKKRGKLTPMY